MSSLHWVLILDFDSTIVSIESLDLLAEISLMDDPEKEKKLKKVISLTKAGMAGEITFQDSLNKRFSLLNIHQSDVDRVCSIIQNYISSSFIKYSAWMKKNANQIFIFSQIPFVSALLYLRMTRIFKDKNFQGIKITNIGSNRVINTNMIRIKSQPTIQIQSTREFE